MEINNFLSLYYCPYVNKTFMDVNNEDRWVWFAGYIKLHMEIYSMMTGVYCEYCCFGIIRNSLFWYYFLIDQMTTISWLAKPDDKPLV